MLATVVAGLRHLDAHRIVQELLGDAADFRRHGRRKEQRLAGKWDELADALDVRNEAHVEHAVGFIDDQKLDAGEQEPPALEVVEQPAGRGDQNVDAAGELGVLIVERDAADDQRHVELLLGAILDEAFLDLRGEFARRLEDQRARHACPRAAILQDRQHRQREGGGLAGAGLRDAEHVAPREHVGNCLLLDRSGSGITCRGDRGTNLVGQAEFGKGHATSVENRPDTNRAG